MSWEHLPELPLDGMHWPLPFAAGLLGITEKDLRRLVKQAGLEPAGTANMAEYRRSGRQPRVYAAKDLIALHEQVLLRSGDDRGQGCGSVLAHVNLLTLSGTPGRE